MRQLEDLKLKTLNLEFKNTYIILQSINKTKMKKTIAIIILAALSACSNNSTPTSSVSLTDSTSATLDTLHVDTAVLNSVN